MNSFVRMISFFTRGATIDNYIFKIHYQVTFTILVVFACIVGYEVYLGKPISCSSRDEDTFTKKDLNEMCWLQTTFIQPESWNKKVGEEVPYPGVDKYSRGDPIIYQNNYHLVLLALWIQALFFYLPRYFWRRMEGGKIYHLTVALRSPFLPDEEKQSKKRTIAEYFASNKNNHQLYFVFYALAHLMNFVNVVAQLIFMNCFWGGDFSSKVHKYGKAIWYMPGRRDALLSVFPRFAKCSLNAFGRSGDIQRHDVLCRLPINSINEKIYVFLWNWSIFVAIISFLALMYRALTVIPVFRSKITSLRVRMVNIRYLEAIVTHYGLGDWLILDMLAKNLDPLSFRDVIDDLAHRLGMKQETFN